jgi:outer membrane protein assembly factor BamB
MTPSIFFVLSALFLHDERAEGWPQYNGANHDRTSHEVVALREWPAAGPPVVWKVATNAGFSSPTIADGKVFTLVSRFHDGTEREHCVALEADSGKELWSAPLSQPEYDGGGGAGTDGNSGGDGPRSTPSYADGRVIVLDSLLLLACFDAQSGETIWEKDLVAEYGGRLIRWQSAASALVDDGRVFVAGGGEGESLLAFDAATGELVWKTGDERMTHATPIAVTIHDVRQVIFYVQSGLVSVDPATGNELWRQEYPYKTSSAASPVVFEELVYVSAGYGVGAGAFVILEEEGEWSVEFLWRKRNDLFNHWSTPVCKDGYLYGMFSFKKYGEGPLQCVELATGDVLWSADGFGPGNCILVGEDLIALSDAGEVVLVEADPGAYNELARAQVLAGKCWSSPTFADGQLYVRSTQEGARIDLSERGSR